MNIFGGILPYVGIKTYYVDKDGYPSEERQDFETEYIVLSWFDYGVMFRPFKVRLSK